MRNSEKNCHLPRLSIITTTNMCIWMDFSYMLPPLLSSFPFLFAPHLSCTWRQSEWEIFFLYIEKKYEEWEAPHSRKREMVWDRFNIWMNVGCHGMMEKEKKTREELLKYGFKWRKEINWFEAPHSLSISASSSYLPRLSKQKNDWNECWLFIYRKFFLLIIFFPTQKKKEKTSP